MAMISNKDIEHYSPLVREIKKSFERYSQNDDYKALFVWMDSWGYGPHFVAAPNKAGVWPWAVFDSDPLVQLEEVEKPVMAFDLKRAFEEQMPEHYSQITSLECFFMSPLYHIPDRAGVIPAQEQAAFHEKALRRTDHLKLVK